VILVDTTVWSIALRRDSTSLNAHQRSMKEELAALIREKRALLMGPVRQELLSGIRERAQFIRIRDHLRAFDDVVVTASDHEQAAFVSNRCRARGIVGDPVDHLMCAIALGNDWWIFSEDHDFIEYKREIPIRLHSPRI
jgi:predicted nucleic acid-binding protein